MEQIKEMTIISKESFVAVGFKWEGTFAEARAGEIRDVQEELKRRLPEIKHVTRPDILLGLSNHDRPDGFTHYAVVEVEQIDEVPTGMIQLSIPTLTYAKYEHKKGQNIEQSYTNLFAWIESKDYSWNKDIITHFEEYPMSQDSYTNDPEFAMMIPIITRI